MKQTLLFLCISVLSILHAQDYRFGKITKDDFQKSKSTIMNDAPAEILFSRGHYRISFNTRTGDLEQNKKVFYRIKIYDKDKTPDQVLSVSIPLHMSSTGSDRDKLISLKATTYNLENNKVTEYKVSKADYFSEKAHRFLNKENFTFPNVKNGSILEYSYEIISPFYSETDTWYFQDLVPVVKSDYTFETNETLSYSLDLRGQYPPRLKEETKEETFNVLHQGSRDPGHTTPSSVQNYKYKINIRHYSIENLPSYSKEAYVLNPRNLLSSVRFELASYRPHNGVPQNFTTTWEAIGKNLLESDRLGKQVSGNGFLDKTVSELIAGKATEEEKINAIFKYCKETFTWNDYLGIYTDNGVRKTFNEKSGNSADINLLLISMLNKAGFNAHPIVLSTVQNGIINYSFPSQSKLNYLIAGVQINNETLLLDATEKHSKINLLPLRASNDRGFMLTSKGVSEIDLSNSVMSSSMRTITAELKPDGLISGNFANTRDNYFVMADLNSMGNNPAAFEKRFVEDYNFETNDFKTLNNNQGLLRHSFKFENIKTDVIGNKIILNPFLFLSTKTHHLNYDTRHYNIEFGSPMTTTNSIKIKIPEGYKVESVPEKKSFEMLNNTAAYAYAVVEKDGFIIAQMQQVYPYSMLPANYYKSLKEFLNNIITTEAQNVVLVKQ